MVVLLEEHQCLGLEGEGEGEGEGEREKDRRRERFLSKDGELERAMCTFSLPQTTNRHTLTQGHPPITSL